MPFQAPAFPRGPYRFVNREYLIISYRTTREALESVVPEPLEIPEDPIVKYEFIRMPDSTGFGDYTESGQVIPVSFRGRKGGYVHSMFLDVAAPISGGRELWGFPKRLGHPTLCVERDSLVGTLRKGSQLVATGSMGYKHTPVHDLKHLATSMMEEPNFLLKIIPRVDCQGPDVLELVEYHLENVQLKGAWTGPVGLSLFQHALAPVAQLPVVEVVSGIHILGDITLGLGKVVHDYLKN